MKPGGKGQAALASETVSPGSFRSNSRQLAERVVAAVRAPPPC